MYAKLIFIISFCVVNACFAVDYSAEFKAGLKGKPEDIFIEKSMIPSSEEIEGKFNINTLNAIKIRLPLDLKRILTEHKENQKPISLAVSCGDRELPFRSFTAILSQGPSRMDTPEYLEYLGEGEIQMDWNKENFISIDPYLGIQASGETDVRGAGHIIMNAEKGEHWIELAQFLQRNKVKIDQIIFTTPMGDPSTGGIFSRFLEFYRMILKPSGRLVSPYFITYDKSLDQNFTLYDRVMPPRDIEDMGLKKELMKIYESIVENTGFDNKGFMGGKNKTTLSQTEQIKKIIPLYKKHYEELGYEVHFITNEKVAKLLDIPEVETQTWQKGDYPYGERNNIALILIPKNDSPF
jgi:hypothetical protein